MLGIDLRMVGVLQSLYRIVVSVVCGPGPELRRDSWGRSAIRCARMAASPSRPNTRMAIARWQVGLCF